MHVRPRLTLLSVTAPRSLRLLPLFSIVALLGGISSSRAEAADPWETLRPREALPSVAFTHENLTHRYTMLRRADRAHYLFCGQGELEVSSRALLKKGMRQARYVLTSTIDGARPHHELVARVRRVSRGAFVDHDRMTRPAAALRRTRLRLGRGCHTVELALPRSTTEHVAVRVRFAIEPATKRPWHDATAVIGAPIQPIQVGSRTVPYHRLDADQDLTIEVDGPAWVRVLARPLGQDVPMSHALHVTRGGETHRAYLLRSTPSRRAKLIDRAAPGDRVGRASEVVFPVPAGRHRLGLQASPGLAILLRAQTAVPGDRGLPAPAEARWALRGRLGLFYDDNILRYSEKFIQRFAEGRDPGRFRVRSLDDIVQRIDLDIHRRFAGLGDRPARVGIGVEHRAYSRNSIKDSTRVHASWWQDLGLGRSLHIASRWRPSFYVRHLRDSDLTGRQPRADPFRAFSFDQADLHATYAHAAGASLRLRYHLGWATLRHSEAFREFDSTNFSAGLRLDQQLTRGWRLSYGFEQHVSAARGFDEPGETRVTSDDTDPTYRQSDIMLAARYRFPGARRSTLFFQTELGLRDYTTDKPANLAPLHAGRDDTLLRLYASWQIDLGKRYAFTLFAQSRTRSSSAPIDLDIGAEKDFDQAELGARLSIRFGG